MKFRLVLLCLALCAAGCRDITSVQLGYISDRDKCRARSEENMAVYAQPTSYPMSEKDKNSTLLVLFCECMKERDWKVAGCPKPKEKDKDVAAKPVNQPNAPTVVIVQAPPAATAPPPADPGSCVVPLNLPKGAKPHKGTCGPTAASPVNAAPAPTPAPAATPNSTPAQSTTPSSQTDTDDDPQTSTLKKILNKE